MLSFSTIHLMGFAASMRLPELPLVIPAWYLRVKNALWGTSALIAAVGLILGQAWAPGFMRWLTPALFGWYWADRVLLSRADLARQTWPLALGFSALILGWVFWTLTRRSVRGFFGEETI